ncbi:HD domain-containing protein [Arthrobacter sp. MYb213]|uniref:HD domain-containing protein n=1 Tax=Arthrobacter sp. MYb213 TaxID=1848595 RepID=UPI000CFD3DCE|nr:HD domain-containing protein [Arthrobacter sp. MYb213]PRB70527.1 metal-dependent phosphohydrolase [Arthrobacter sp. MYb213]
MTKLQPASNLYGQDVSAFLGPSPTTLFEQRPLLSALWEDAKQYLKVRSNDAHTLIALSLANALLSHQPDANADIVLPAILLHDIGWSSVDPSLVLSAIAPGGGNKELVLQHEKEGARLAEDILVKHAVALETRERITFIIDGHDSRKESTSLEDSLVKDADKLWRLTPHGINTVMDWFGLTRVQAVDLCESRVVSHLFTDAARIMATGLLAVERANLFEQRLALDSPS